MAMAFLCHSALSTPKIRNTTFLFPSSFSTSQSRGSVPWQRKPPIFSSCTPAGFSVSGGRKPEAVVTETSSSGETNRSSGSMKLTYLEGNSWLLVVDGLNILVDPILVGNLDFGVPWLYDGAKKVVKNFQLNSLSDTDCLLITQSLDDHCHVRTLKPLSTMFPDLKVVSTPNAEPILSELFKNVTYLEPGESSEIEGKNGSKVTVCASAGPILGPPWQRPENGYFIVSQEKQISLYVEPHCVYDESSFQNNKADIVITPVKKQLLPAFTLVSGQEDAVKLARLLGARFVVPMNNGDLEAKGILSTILRSEGTVDSFKKLLSRELPGAQVLEPIPGVPLEIPPQ
ncbi:hypothetical protein EJ110_NYTH28295 [Nymphaea thermarum]|nr:hypothetical protein EJ110_NYTH28295 [Nymphaea thermarum]